MIQYVKITSCQHPIRANYTKHSQKCFKIQDTWYTVRLENLSSNGTFVNGFYVGKVCSVNLNNGPIIAIVHVDNNVFTFVNIKVMRPEYNPLPVYYC